ncbi:enoyl-CoA hydratase/isomerase family protein [Bradyrhizobium sp. 14AA]
MTYKHIIFEEEGAVATITLNRPNVLNALSVELSEELFSAVRNIQASETIRFVVIKGAGGNFCAGDDLTEMFSKWGNSMDGFMRRARIYQAMANALEDLDKITISAVDGYVVGGGLEITMACDFVVATERAKWGMPEVDWGIVPGWGGTSRLSRLIGRRLTKEINIIGALFPARRALELNLFNRVVANDALDAEVNKLLEVLKSKSNYAIRHVKFLVNKGADGDLQAALGFEALNAAVTAAANGLTTMGGADNGKGLQAFKNKEKDPVLSKRRELAQDFWVD